MSDRGVLTKTEVQRTANSRGHGFVARAIGKGQGRTWERDPRHRRPDPRRLPAGVSTPGVTFPQQLSCRQQSSATLSSIKAHGRQIPLEHSCLEKPSIAAKETCSRPWQDSEGVGSEGRNRPQRPRFRAVEVAPRAAHHSARNGRRTCARHHPHRRCAGICRKARRSRRRHSHSLSNNRRI